MTQEGARGRSRATEEPPAATPAPGQGTPTVPAQGTPPGPAQNGSARLPAAAAATAAIGGIAQLTRKQPEGVTAIEPMKTGWIIAVEVIEDKRVPSSADILATYEAELAGDGTLLAYRRTRRYMRGRGDGNGRTR